MMTSTEDLEHWIKIQLNPPDKYKSLVQQSHKNLSSTIGEPNANAYASGWFTNNDERLYIQERSITFIIYFTKSKTKLWNCCACKSKFRMFPNSFLSI